MSILEKIQRTQPLILNLANFVTPQRVRTLSVFIGASPLMTSEIAELESLVENFRCCVVNIGTI
ncbi:Hydroxyethylthiazole kinase [Lactococcus lactis]|nr:Hydroxyethylthiazole kinase [Lactococcus lactis]